MSSEAGQKSHRCQRRTRLNFSPRRSFPTDVSLLRAASTTRANRITPSLARFTILPQGEPSEQGRTFPPPAGGSKLGDGKSVVLVDGIFRVANCCDPNPPATGPFL